jgi:hypothetical protein
MEGRVATKTASMTLGGLRGWSSARDSRIRKKWE